MLFKDPVLFELPVLPRVQKFVRTKLVDASGIAHPMLAMPEALGAGLMLWAMAQSEMIAFYTNPSRHKPTSAHARPDDFSARIGVGICSFHPTRRNRLLNHAELIIFSNMVDHMIQNELVQFCQQSPELAPMLCIKSFCDRYDFSEADFSEGALKQMYLRWRRGTASMDFAPQVSTQFSFVPCQIAA